MGYGATSFAKAPTQRLTDFNLTIVENNDCNQRLPQLDEVPHGIIESQVCAQDFIMHRDTCQVSRTVLNFIRNKKELKLIWKNFRRETLAVRCSIILEESDAENAYTIT